MNCYGSAGAFLITVGGELYIYKTDLRSSIESLEAKNRINIYIPYTYWKLIEQAL